MVISVILRLTNFSSVSLFFGAEKQLKNKIMDNDEWFYNMDSEYIYSDDQECEQ